MSLMGPFSLLALWQRENGPFFAVVARPKKQIYDACQWFACLRDALGQPFAGVIFMGGVQVVYKCTGACLLCVFLHSQEMETMYNMLL